MSNKNEQMPENEELRTPLQEDAETPGERDAAPESAGGVPEEADAPAQDIPQDVADREAFLEKITQEENAPKPEKPVKIKKDRRKLRYGGMATALTAVAVVVIVLINVVASVLSDRFPLNLDLTSNKMFTLNDTSVKVAKSLASDVKVYIFAEEKLFTQPTTTNDGLNDMLRQFHEALKQYNSLSGGKLTFEFIDLTSDPTKASGFEEYEVTSGTILFVAGNRYQKATINDLYSYDQDSYTGQTTNLASEVEQVLASRLLMVTSENTPGVVFLTGHEEDSNAVSGIQSLLEVNNYTVESLNFTGSEELSEDAVLAVIAAPSKDYSDDEIERLRAWLDNDGKRGRNLFVLINFSASCPNLYEFLRVDYGIEVTDQLVMETSSERVYRGYPYYTYADISSGGNVGDLSGKRVLAPVTRQLITHFDSDTEETQYNLNVMTFPESAQLVPMAEATDENAEAEPKDAEEYPIVGMAQSTAWSIVDNSAKVSTNVLVSGCQQMFYSSMMSLQTVYNEQLLLNEFNGMTGNKVAVSISNKSLERETLEFNMAQAYIFFGIFVVAIPVILLIVCLVVFLRRRRL